MKNLMACRICLITDIKLYEMCKYRLKTAFEILTGIQTGEEVLYVCSYCGTMLNKFIKFKQKCFTSQQVLDCLYAEHDMITMDLLKSINRNNICFPYTIESTGKYDTNFMIKQEMYHDNYIKIDNNESDNDNNGYANDNNDYANENDGYDNFGNDINNITDNYDNNDIINNKITINDSKALLNTDSDEEPLSKKIKKKKRCKKDNIDNEIYNKKIKVEYNDSNVKENIDSTQHRLVVLSKEEQMQEVLSRKESSNYKNSVYKCESCFKGFMSDVTFTNHMFRHDARCGPEICDICQTRWPDTRSLRAHTLISHERKYICTICGQTSRSKFKAMEHLKWHNGATFSCKLCGATFERSTSYLTHVRLRHPSTHRCSVCGDSFIGESGLKLHMKKAHRNEKAESMVDNHKCDSCQFKFKNPEALARHSELGTETGCDVNMIPCFVCGDHFPSDTQRAEHMKIHRKAPPSRICSYTSEGVRRRRETRTNTHVCECCGRQCVSKASLVNHQRTHTGEKPFECELCHKRFSVQQRLQIHVRTHTGERPFPCGRCHKAFKHKAALNRHSRVHSGARPYACPQCGKRFSQSNSVKQHCAGVHCLSAPPPRR